MLKNLWFQTNLTDDGGPICRALRYRDEVKQLSEFVATLQANGDVHIDTQDLHLAELRHIGERFYAAIEEFKTQAEVKKAESGDVDR